MKIAYFIAGWVCFVFSSNYIHAQSFKVSKPALQISDIVSWPEITSTEGISNDGKYFYYGVENICKDKETVFICSAYKNWVKKIVGGRNIHFSDDSKFVSWMLSDDTLITEELGDDKEQVINNVKKFKIVKINGAEKLIYVDKAKKELHFKSWTGQDERIEGVINYWMSPDSRNMILQVEKIKGNKKGELLTWLNLTNKQQKIFWSGLAVDDLMFDKLGNNVVFIITENRSKSSQIREIYLFGKNGKNPERITTSEDIKLWPDYILSGIDHLGDHGDKVFFYMERKPKAEKSTGFVFKGVDVYSCMDTIPMISQITKAKTDEEVPGFTRFLAVIDIHKKIPIRLQYDAERLQMFKENDDFVIAIPLVYLKWGQDPLNYIVSTSTGERKKFPHDALGITPDGKYLYYSKGKTIHANLYSYEIKTDQSTNFTKLLPAFQYVNPLMDKFFIYSYASRFEVKGLLEGTDEVVVSDKYDLWKVDLSGKIPPVSLTNGYGVKNDIQFSLSDFNYIIRGSRLIPVINQGQLLLTSFDYKTKDNDYYTINLKGQKDQKRLTNGGEHYESVGFIDWSEQAPLKARDKEVYLISRSDVKHSPNYFLTSDFKDFTPVSNVAPEKKFNWMTSELIKYQDTFGNNLNGILYKPENFDSLKKYPIVFYYYTLMSNELNIYRNPTGDADNTFNIAYFVSNGYLVFLPDLFDMRQNHIYHDGALSSVLGAIHFFEGVPYVNTKKIGNGGGSFGGSEANYIVSHTDRFTATFSFAGNSDYLALYGLPTHGGGPDFTEFNDLNDSTLPLFIANSGKLNIERITTPLLLIHNEKDWAVRFDQSLGFFDALWKAGKKAWMLQYDDEGHGFGNTEPRLDYTMRLRQFLDHYLKGVSPPKWMTQGIPARLKGLENGLQLDYDVQTPQPVVK